MRPVNYNLKIIIVKLISQYKTKIIHTTFLFKADVIFLKLILRILIILGISLYTFVMTLSA